MFIWFGCKIPLLTVFFASAVVCFFPTLSHAQDVRVNPYFRSNGTFVQPHFRTPPNRNSFDNFSTRGNSNPYTGKRGSVDPFRSPSRGNSSLKNFGQQLNRSYKRSRSYSEFGSSPYGQIGQKRRPSRSPYGQIGR